MLRRIIYYCQQSQEPTGGDKIIYRHAELLAAIGFQAHVLHLSPGFRYQQLSHQPSILYRSGLNLNRHDLLVLPEDIGPGLATVAPGIAKVLFNQNAYYSFHGFADLDGALPPYRDPAFVGVLTVSEDSRAYLEYAFPGLRCSRIRLSFDQALFSCADPLAKRRQICFMTRKNQPDWVQVIQILRSRGSLEGWRLVPISNMLEMEVARVMEASALYLAFGAPEGLSLANLEAVASGCRLIGYSGMGGRDFFDALGCLEIAQGDIRAFVMAVEREMLRFEQDPDRWHADRLAACSAVRLLHAPEQERRDLEAFYQPLVVQERAPGTVSR